jgi:hypothetical protein
LPVVEESMADEGRPEDDAPPPKPKRRRRPQTLDLTAKEVKADEKPASGARTESPRADRGAEESRSSWDQMRSIVPAPVLTGALGVIAGALVVYLLMPRSEGADPRVGQLTQQIATLSARIESLAARPAPAADPGGLGARIDRLTAAIGEAEQRLAAVEKRPEPKAPDLSSVNQRAAAIEGTLKELRSGLSDLKRIAEEAPEAASSQAADKLAGRIGGLEDRIAALAAVRAAQPTNADLAASIVSLNALGTSLRSGKPFANELEAARSRLGERAGRLASLEPFAATGLPTVEMLERQFSELVPKILSGPEANGNFFERLMTNAGRLVQVRPVGEPAGNSAGAIVARAETKLARRDLSGAIAEVEALPEADKATAAKWLAAAKQRRDAEAAVQSLAEASILQAREAGKP